MISISKGGYIDIKCAILFGTLNIRKPGNSYIAMTCNGVSISQTTSKLIYKLYIKCNLLHLQDSYFKTYLIL